MVGSSIEGHATSTADAVQAFIQSFLPDDDLTYVILPRQLWLPAWKSKFNGKVAVRLRKSLYGHSQAGRLWQEFPESRISRLGASQIPEFPSNFLFHIEGHKMLLNMYVDDLTLSGKRGLHAKFGSSFLR